MASEEIKTLGIVMRRTNYGEADRILNLITPVGKVAAIAKGVRKPKSKLAGGVEMFCLSEMVIHKGRAELGIVTSTKMLKHYNEILKSLEDMELAAEILKKTNRAAEGAEQADFFEIVKQSFEGLNVGADRRLVEGWFLLNLRRVGGEEMNLYRDEAGERLVAEKRYDWDGAGEVFRKNEQGEYGADEIKMLRLMLRAELATVRRVRVSDELILKIYGIIKKWES